MSEPLPALEDLTRAQRAALRHVRRDGRLDCAYGTLAALLRRGVLERIVLGREYRNSFGGVPSEHGRRLIDEARERCTPRGDFA